VGRTVAKIARKLSPVEFALQLLRVDAIRYWVALTRYLFFTFVLRRLRTLDLDSKSIGVNTVLHNLKNLKALRSLSVARSHQLIRPLSVVQCLGRNTSVLSVGPRSEGELLNLASFGFRPRNIRGLDLISYSKWIDLGDMHNMPYRDNAWDAVILGWCLAYSDNRPRAAREVIRVAKDGAVIAVGVEYNPFSSDELSQQLGYEVCDRVRMISVQDVLDLFAPHVDHVYFAQDVPALRRDQINEILVIFSLKK
jgi:hypothetical protein